MVWAVRAAEGGHGVFVNGHTKGEKLRAASAAYECYQHAREQILPMAAASPADHALSPSEVALLAELDDLWRAGPEAIAELRRRYGKAISGVRRSKYEGQGAELARSRLNRDRLRLVQNSDAALWVGEPPALGGFGLRSENTVYNDDTLRFFRILSLLNDAAVLREFRTTARATVWEIGGGWGGFAHHFKMLFPGVTYVISAAPTLLLLSATYLMTLFPTARVRFFKPSDPAAFRRDWAMVDFAFMPQTDIDQLQPENLTLTVDVGMLERFSPPRILANVQRAFDLGCRYIVSDCSSDEPHAANVRSAIERWYWLHPMAVPAHLERRFGVRKGGLLLAWRRLRA